MVCKIWNENNKEKFISLVTPVSGRNDLFVETIKSIREQTSKDFEWIITDDTSDAEERSRIFDSVEKFAVENPHIQTTYIFTKPRLYQSKNVNQGLRLAAGKFIHILHSDDLIHPDTIDYEIQYLKNYPDCACLYYKETLFYDKPNLQYKEGISFVCPKLFLDIDYLLGHPLPSATVFNRELLFNTSLMDSRFKFICDFDLFFSFTKEAIKAKKFFIYSNASFIGWRRHGASVSTSDMQFHREHLKLMKKIFFSEFNQKSPLIEKPDLINYVIRAYHSRILRIFEFFIDGNKHLYLKDLPELMKIHAKEHKFYNKIRYLSKKFKFPQNLKNKIYNNIRKKHIFSYVNLKPEDIPKGRVLNITNQKESPFDYTINCTFDNEFNLYDKREIIKDFDTILLSNFYFNRYAKRTLNEVIKYINKEQNLIITLYDNMFLSAADAMRFISDKYKNRFELISHKAYSDEKHILVYKCIESYKPESNGLTIVLSLDEHDRQYIERFIGIIKKQNFENYEILILQKNDVWQHGFVSDDRISFLNRDLIDGDVKNYIAKVSKFDDILFIYEGIMLSDKLKEDIDKRGLVYEIMLPHKINADNERLNDYYYMKGTIKHPLSYSDFSDFSIIEPNAYFIKKQVLKAFDFDDTYDEQNIKFSQQAHEKNFIVEIIDTNFTDTTGKMEELPFIPYKNPLYEQLYDKIAINGKIYEQH